MTNAVGDGMPRPWGDAEAAIARVNEQIAEAQQRAAQAERVREDIDGLRERATSPRRELTVTVDATGRFTDLKLTRDAMQLHPDALARLIVETAARAQRAAGERAIEIAAEAFGADSPAVEHLRGEVAARTPDRFGDDDSIGYR